MNNKRATKRSLPTSITALVMCVVMLVGTTFAWFTDTASTAVNKIQAGNLDVQLLDENEKSLEGKTLSWVKAADHDDEDVLWEPGCTYDLERFKIKNSGNLALKYKVKITGITGDKNSVKLLNAIDFTVKVADGSGNTTTTNPTAPTLDNFEGTLAAGKETGLITITGQMKKEAGNEYQGLTIDGISITVYATQLNSEADSNGTDYDENAAYNYKSATIMDNSNGGKTTTLESGKTYTIGTATVTVDGQNITYANNDGNAVAQSVTITTEGGDLTVNAPEDTIYHYGEASSVRINAIKGNSFHEFGKVDILEIQRGRVVVENGNNVAVLQVKPVENEVPVVAVPQSVVLETKLQVTQDKSVRVAVIDEKSEEIADETFTVKQSGETVENAIPEELVKVLSKDDSGAIKMPEEPKTYKAMIGTTPYESFDSALTNAEVGSTIKLMDNDNASNLVIDKAVTIDLNGKTLTATTKQPHVKDAGVLTIQDSGVNGQLTLGDKGAIQLNKGKLILNSGKIYRNGDGCVFLMGKAEFEMNGGTLLCTKGACVDAGYTVNEGQAGKVTINGGTIESKTTATCAVYIAGRAVIGGENTSTAEAVITGGTITSAGSKAVEVDGTNSTLTVSGGTFNGNITNTSGTVTFTNSSYKLNGSYVVNSEEALAAAVAADYTDTENDNNSTKESNIKNIALGSNITLTNPITIRKTLTIDGNNYKLTANYTDDYARAINVWDNKDGMTVTLKDLSIVGPTSGYECRGISTGDTKDLKLVLDGCDISTLYYAIQISKGDVNPEIIVRNTTFGGEEIKGYCAIQTFVANTKATFENCTLVGNNNWDGSSDDDFSTIVINKEAKGSNLTFKNCKIMAFEKAKVGDKEPANENFLSLRTTTNESGEDILAGNVVVTFEGCQFFLNGQELTGDAVKAEMDILGDTTLTIK